MELHCKAIGVKYIPDYFTEAGIRFELIDSVEKNDTILDKYDFPLLPGYVLPDDSECKFTIKSIDSNILRISLINGSEVFGALEIQTQSFDCGVSLETVEKIKKQKGVKRSPQITFGLFIGKKGQTPWIDAPFERDFVSIKVLEAKEIPQIDDSGICNPYLNLYLTSSTNRFKTNTKENTLEPHWEEKFSIPVTDVETDVLNIKLKNQGREKDKQISKISIPIKEIPKKSKDTWIDLKPQGKLHITYHLHVHTPKTDVDDDEPPPPPPLPESPPPPPPLPESEHSELPAEELCLGYEYYFSPADESIDFSTTSSAGTLSDWNSEDSKIESLSSEHRVEKKRKIFGKQRGKEGENFKVNICKLAACHLEEGRYWAAVEIKGTEKQFKTDVAMKAKAPMWFDNKMEFRGVMSDDVFEVTVGEEENVVGKVEIKLSNIKSGKEVEDWWEIPETNAKLHMTFTIK